MLRSHTSASQHHCYVQHSLDHVQAECHPFGPLPAPMRRLKGLHSAMPTLRQLQLRSVPMQPSQTQYPTSYMLSAASCLAAPALDASQASCNASGVANFQLRSSLSCVSSGRPPASCQHSVNCCNAFACSWLSRLLLSIQDLGTLLWHQYVFHCQRTGSWLLHGTHTTSSLLPYRSADIMDCGTLQANVSRVPASCHMSIPPPLCNILPAHHCWHHHQCPHHI